MEHFIHAPAAVPWMLFYESTSQVRLHRRKAVVRERLRRVEHRTPTMAQSQPVVHNRWETVMELSTHIAARKTPWNKGKLVGQKAPLKLKDIWAIRARLQIGHRTRELALFNLAIDSKLRSCDLVTLRVRDVCHGTVVAARTIVM
jgi:hypothetical protein